MQISLTPASLESWSGDVLALGLLESDLKENIPALEKLCGNSLEKSLQQKTFTGKEGDLAIFQLLDGNPYKIVLIGLGIPEELELNDLRRAGAIAAKESQGIKGTLGIALPWNPFNSTAAAQAVSEAIRLSLYKDIRFLSEPKPKDIPSKVELIGVTENIQQLSKNVNSICDGVEFARELVDAPPNELTPSILAKKAEIIAESSSMTLTILDKKKCLEKGMGAYLAVSQGSDLEPKFIHLKYKPKGTIKRRIALVGKGLTFDSGGYNLKVGAAQIELMKFDMGGSAAVLGTANAISKICPPNVEIHFIIASCENMVNGSAVHPGDIVKASNGKTIEINNTDAEGRLTLADALVYACKLNPDEIIDLATLTGACVIALGDEIAGLWTESDALAESIKNAANAAGEGIWRMPLYNSYKDGLKSLLADLKNTGPRAGGSITAALFLKEFVEPDIAWAHIDIAGPVWAEKDRDINPAGATGYGVRTLVNLVCRSDSDSQTN